MWFSASRVRRISVGALSTLHPPPSTLPPPSTPSLHAPPSPPISPPPRLPSPHLLFAFRPPESQGTPGLSGSAPPPPLPLPPSLFPLPPGPWGTRVARWCQSIQVLRTGTYPPCLVSFVQGTNSNPLPHYGVGSTRYRVVGWNCPLPHREFGPALASSSLSHGPRIHPAPTPRPLSATKESLPSEYTSTTYSPHHLPPPFSSSSLPSPSPSTPKYLRLLPAHTPSVASSPFIVLLPSFHFAGTGYQLHIHLRAKPSPSLTQPSYPVADSRNSKISIALSAPTKAKDKKKRKKEGATISIPAVFGFLLS